MRVVLCGAAGRMGSCVAQELDAGGIEVIGVDRKGEISNLGDVKEYVDAVMDFSSPAAVYEVLDFALDRGVPAVIGTTGHDERQLIALREAAERIPVFYANNMSFGVALFCKQAATIAAAFPYADVEIVETHHSAKADVPSGTALLIANAIIAARGGGKVVVGRTATREHGEIGISSLRLGQEIGRHEVQFCTEFQKITLTHQAYSRRLYAVGAVNALKFVFGADKGLYSVKDIPRR